MTLTARSGLKLLNGQRQWYWTAEAERLPRTWIEKASALVRLGLIDDYKCHGSLEEQEVME